MNYFEKWEENNPDKNYDPSADSCVQDHFGMEHIPLWCGEDADCFECWSREVLERPEIVCLCGSTQFYKTFDDQNFRLTLGGKIVLSIGCNTKSDEGLKLSEESKIRLDELHKRKIDLADCVYILNVDGYIGDSTKSEIEYAEKIGKKICYLEI